MSSSAFTPAVLTVSSGAGSGSGEKNYITNPSAASAITGWGVVGDFTLSRTTAASDLPREYSTATGIKVVATSGTQSTADYMYFDFNLDDVDLGKKLKIQWSQKKIGTYSAGQLAVVITTQADRTTALVTPQTTAIPASDLDFVTSFDSPTTAALSLVIRATADMTTGDGICISDVVVGPGTITQGAAISEWESYTPVLTNITIGNGTVSGRYRRVGSNIEGNINVVSGTTTTYSSSDWEFGIPSNLNYLEPGNNTVETVVGIAIGQINDGGDTEQRNGFATFINGTTTKFKIKRADALANGTANYWNSSTTSASNNLNFTRLSIWFSFPVSQFSGSGTVSLGAGAQVEYASNDGSGGTAADTTYNTGMVYGPAGSVIPAVNSTSTVGTGYTRYLVNFQYPIQSSDEIVLEFDEGGNGIWTTVPINLTNCRMMQGSSQYGIWIQQNNSTSIYVGFGNKGRLANNASYAGDGAAWSGVSTTKYRVRKAKASSPVGFGKADSTSFGLVGPRRGQQALTFSSTPAGWSLVRAVGIYYQDQDGNHRLKFNIVASATTNTLIEATISNVTFKNVTSYYQSVNCLPALASNQGISYVNPNTGTVSVSTAVSQGQFRVSGDVELESKPSWA